MRIKEAKRLRRFSGAIGLWLLIANPAQPTKISSFHLADQAAIRNTLPAEAYHADARVYSRLTDSDAIYLFAAVPAYVAAIPALAKLPAEIHLWQRVQQQWQKTTAPIHHAEQACLHPRQAVSGDINGDNLLDIVVACSGDKSSPTQGELPMLLQQQRDNSFVLSRPKIFNAKPWHALALADLKGNGVMDVVLAGAQHELSVFYNDGFGQFQQGEPLIGSEVQRRYLAVEFIDIDGDGQLDLLLGAQGQSSIWLNNGHAGFEPRLEVALPREPDYPLVVDFYWDHNDQHLYLLRTSESYEGTALQSVHWPSLASQLHWADPDGQWQSQLIATDDDHGVLLSSDQLDSPYRYLIK